MLDFLEPGATFFVPAASVIFGPSFQDGVGFVSARMGNLGFWLVVILEWEPTKHGANHFSLALSNQAWIWPNHFFSESSCVQFRRRRRLPGLAFIFNLKSCVIPIFCSRVGPHSSDDP
jgi:hypothetical protein